MIRLSFFKTPKPKQFEFYNRYYDPIKDRQAKVRQQVRVELGKEQAPAGSSISFSQNRRGYRGEDYYRKASQRASIRMAIVLAGAIAASYVILQKLDVWEMLF